MVLKNKKLLVLTGCNGADDIIQYAKSKGVFVIATDYYEESDVKKMADVSYNISTTDIDGIKQLAVKYKVDGITAGTSESSMFTVLNVTNSLNLPFYTNQDVLDKINDKKVFKDLLIKYGVGVTKEISYDSEIKYPVIIKPVDSSGGKGINICNNIVELNEAIPKAIHFSRKGQYLIEEYMQGKQEVFINYTIVDGDFSISCAFDNFKNRGRGSGKMNPDVNLYPSKYTKEFIDLEHDKIVKAFKSIGIRNGVISVQAIYENGKFYVYEAGYRLGGSQSYIFSDAVNNVSHLKMMVNYSLTGKMTEDIEFMIKDNPFFEKPCCQINIPIVNGKIVKIIGVKDIKSINGVLNVTQVRNEGDVIRSLGTTSSLGARIHVMGYTADQLEGTINKIIDTVNFIGVDGKSMNYNNYKLDIDNIYINNE